MSLLSARLVALACLSLSTLALPTRSNSSDSVTLKWIGDTPEYVLGTTFGIPWPKGEIDPQEATFSLSTDDGDTLPVQSWVTGYWRDGL